MRRLALLALVLASGCVAIPHAAILGQTAAPLQRGEVVGSTSLGVGYQSASSQQTTTGTLQLPALEANLAAAIADRVGLNLHLSDAGLLPGVKVTVVHAGSFDFALMPELGGAYYYSHSTSGGTFSVNSGGSNGMLLAGARALISVSLLYAGVGYHFMEIWSSTTDNTTVPPTNSTITSQYHSLLFNLGLDLQAGAVKLRPEVAFVLTPAGSSHDDRSNTTSQLGYEWTILPNLTVAVSTKPPAPK
jgi:hypothetical protein